ncbi:selenium cofactor biosynthesis protein YqeC [Gracilinema caldarium]|uniref:selenium cofactor biosynthesis protein YqeC n=1 Tax=Gracilinema caldarium TaxID=215591 RepID=UPI0026EA3C69|nr:selenium cofactor biosynthesis protein YqeC [Gracilinema caldarium]
MQNLSDFFANVLNWPEDRGLVIAAVGGGGKSALLYLLAKIFAEKGKRVALTTTTHIYDPRTETEPRLYDSVTIIPELEQTPPGNNVAILERLSALAVSAPKPGSVTVLASKEAIPDTSVHQSHGKPLLYKLRGIHPAWAGALGSYWDLVLVEADGSKHLPVKAPAEHEPVVPDLCDIVLGCVGLDCLGLPMDEVHVHRPALFSAVTGCGLGEPIDVRHLINLAYHPQGLFKGCPDGSRRYLFLNKADYLAAGALHDVEASLCSLATERDFEIIIGSVKQDRIYSRIDCSHIRRFV